MPASISDLILDPTIRTVAMATGLLGLTAGASGAISVVRRQSLQGDVVSHAALPGIALAVLIGPPSPWLMILFGAMTGWLAIIAVDVLTTRLKLSLDSAFASVLASFFGLGLMLKTRAQKLLTGTESAGLDQFLFGQAATIRTEDLTAIVTIALIIAVFFMLFWKPIALICFDRDLAHTLGYRVGLWNALLTTLLIMATIVGLQAVGVVLMTSLLVAPAVAARFWTHRLPTLVMVAAIIGAISGILGTWASSILPRIATGPIIVLIATAVVPLSAFTSKLRKVTA